MKQLAMFLFCILSPLTMMGQYTSQKERPVWIDGCYIERANSYIEVVSAVGYDESSAREKAINKIAENRSRATGQRVKVNTQGGGNIAIYAEDELTVKCRIIEEFCERLGPGDYRMSMLVQTAKNPTFEYETVNISDKYPFSYTSFIPGMAQIYKGNTTKGIAFIASEMAAIGGIVYSQSRINNCRSLMKRTYNTEHLNIYSRRISNFSTVRNVCIGAAVAVYVWNFIDAAVAPGRKRVVVAPTTDIGGYSLFNMNGSADAIGLSAVLTF